MASTEIAKPLNDCEHDKVSENLESLELLWKSDAGVSDAIRKFRDCHDLCKVVGDKSVLKVDQCALDFRYLSLESASVAKRISNQWLDTAIMVFENLKEIDDSAKRTMFKNLGDQAEELSYCFKIFALWAKDVSGRFHRAQDGTIREGEEFKKGFENGVEAEQALLKELEKEHETVSNYRKECEASENTWASKMKEARTFSAYALNLTRLLSSAENRLLDAQKSEQIVAKDMKQIQQQLEERKHQYEKAKSFGETTAGTVELLAHLEYVYTEVSTYWATEAEAFKSDSKQPEETSEVVTKAEPLEPEDKEPAESGEAVIEKYKQPEGSSEANAEAEALEPEGKEPAESTEAVKKECKEPKNSSEGVEVAVQNDKLTEDKIATWNKAKAEINAYAMRLSKASNAFNFQTEAKPPEAKKVKFEKVDFTLCVPTTVNLQENNIPITKTTVRLCF